MSATQKLEYEENKFSLFKTMSGTAQLMFTFYMISDTLNKNFKTQIVLYVYWGIYIFVWFLWIMAEKFKKPSIHRLILHI